MLLRPFQNILIRFLPQILCHAFPYSGNETFPFRLQLSPKNIMLSCRLNQPGLQLTPPLRKIRQPVFPGLKPLGKLSFLPNPSLRFLQLPSCFFQGLPDLHQRLTDRLLRLSRIGDTGQFLQPSDGLRTLGLRRGLMACGSLAGIPGSGLGLLIQILLRF